MARAMANLMQVPLETIEVAVTIVNPRHMEDDTAEIEVSCAVTLEGTDATERIEAAKQLLIRTSPPEIAELLIVEVNSQLSEPPPYTLRVLEVAPPEITGRAVQVPDYSGSGGEGVVFDDQDVPNAAQSWPTLMLWTKIAMVIALCGS